MLTTYQGSSVAIFFDASDDAGAPLALVNPVVDLFDSNQVERLTDAVAVLVAPGLYRITHDIPAGALPGIWRAELAADGGFRGSEYFEVLAPGEDSALVTVPRGTVGSIDFDVQDDEGAPMELTAPLVSIYDPSGTLVVADLAPAEVAPGLYRLLYPAPADAVLGIYRAALEDAGGPQGSEYFQITAAVEADALLASLVQFSARLGYTPEGDEATRATWLLGAASGLIRDEARDEFLTEVPARIRDICVEVAVRAFVNPEALTQHALGDENKSHDRAGVGGGEAVYLTRAELRACRRAGGRSNFGSVTLVGPYSGDDEVAVIAQ